MNKILASILGLSLVTCQNPQTSAEETAAPAETEVKSGMHPEWSRKASIYEVNIRQHTPEGTFNAFRAKLPELKELGVNILWIMPVQPIGMENRKGGLGSYYSIQNYTAVNPEFGTMEDFKNLVNASHDAGFKVILDWVGNHTAWDAVWMESHPEWYTHNDEGQIIAPVEDWSDVADLNYDNQDMRKAMIDALKFWVNETNIDGYRCDVAMMVPMDFWDEARVTLDSIKPVFMLAEAEGAEFHEKAFDMTYGWEFHHIMNQIAKGEMTIADIATYQAKVDTTYPDDAYRMFFTTNHDENSWNGTVFERMADDYKPMFVLAATYPNGMPLIYSGQEYGLNKRLRFFDKDTVTASDSTLFSFYQKVIALKMSHPALLNGSEQGDYQIIPTDPAGEVLAYTREKNGASIVVLLNFGDEHAEIGLPENVTTASWMNVMNGKTEDLSTQSAISVAPNSFILLKSQK